MSFELQTSFVNFFKKSSMIKTKSWRTVFNMHFYSKKIQKLREMGEQPVLILETNLNRKFAEAL